MSRFSVLFLILGLFAASAQEKPSPNEKESRDLQSALAETSNSPAEIIRTLEKHLTTYPTSPQKDEIIRVIAKSAVETGDKKRIIRYGEMSLASNMDQPQLLERVATTLLEAGDKESAERALKYSKKFEEILRSLEREGPSSKRGRAQILEEMDRALGRALVLEAWANGNIGNTAEAIAVSRKAWEQFQSAETARELAKWLEKSDQNQEAIKWYAAAFAARDSKNTEAQRSADRTRLGELYRKEHNGSEAGLGDLVLQAWDQSSANATLRAGIQKKRDPNSGASSPMDFTLSGVEGPPLALSSLKGKVLVLDFWATWCGPCRIQHPLYEKVREKFKDRDDVLFLNIDTDEDTSLVPGFLEQNNWSKKVYFEDGLGGFLRVSSIPTTIIIGKDGQIFTRMNGFVPDRFVDLLTDRIREALAASGR